MPSAESPAAIAYPSKVGSDPTWERWAPRERAVLCFIVQGESVLLIHKHRGLGAGKINGPGGKIEAGETPLQAAIRETEEEIGVTPQELSKRGELRFQFADGYSLHCTLFLSTAYMGTLKETAEATPFWQGIASVPYGQMWEDDRYWLPHVLAGAHVQGWFHFDGYRLLSKRVELDGKEQPV